MCKPYMEDFFELERRAREAADQKVQPRQAALKVGDFFVRQAHGLTVYSEVLDAAALILDGRAVEDLTEEEREEYEGVRDSYKEMENYRFTRSYSRVCPKGELGDVHVSTVSRVISREEFRAAQKNEWA